MRTKTKNIYAIAGLGSLGLAIGFLTPSIEQSRTRNSISELHRFSPLPFTRATTPEGAEYRFGDYSLEVARQTQNSNKLIICLPILSGEKILPNYFARAMFRNGYDTAIIHRNRKLHDELSPENLNACLKWLVDSHCTLIDELSVEYDKVGIIGISLGGIVGTLIAGHSDKIDSLVSVVSGQNLSRILIESDDPGIARFRAVLLERCTKEELAERLEATITYDPPSLCPKTRALRPEARNKNSAQLERELRWRPLVRCSSPSPIQARDHSLDAEDHG